MVVQVVSACAYQHTSVVKAMRAKLVSSMAALFYSQFTDREDPCNFDQLSGGRQPATKLLH